MHCCSMTTPAQAVADGVGVAVGEGEVVGEALIDGLMVGPCAAVPLQPAIKAATTRKPARLTTV